MKNQRFRAAPVLVLAVLAPFCAEYLVGSISLSRLVYLPFLMPLYGAAAVLVHEIVRRAGRGWPTILGLGAAFGAFQAGLVDASMFDPNYAGLDLSGPMVPWIDWNVYWGMAFIVNHAILGIAVPIALTEALFDRGGAHRPWMGMTGHWSTVAWLAGGFALIGADERPAEGYWPTLEQQGFTLVLTAAFVVAAYWGHDPDRAEPPVPPSHSSDNRLPATWKGWKRNTGKEGNPAYGGAGQVRRGGGTGRGGGIPAMARIRGGEEIHEGVDVHRGAGIRGRYGVRNGHEIRKGAGAETGKRVAAGDGVFESYGDAKGRGVAKGGEVPSLVGSWLAASLVLLVFNFLPPTWLGVALGLGLLGASLAVGLRASRSPGWSDRHRLAMAAGAVTVTAPLAFVVGEFVGDTGVVDLVGHGLFALVAAGLLAWGFRRLAGEDLAGASGWHGRP